MTELFRAIGVEHPPIAGLAAAGTALVTTPFWVEILQDVNLIASTVAAITGAITGLVIVYRLWKRSRP